MKGSVISETISHYRILNKLGAGGMGEVYLAEDTRLDRKIAIKFLPLDSVAEGLAGKRLIREAQSAAKLDHPNICGIHEVAEEDGRGESAAARSHWKTGTQSAFRERRFRFQPFRQHSGSRFEPGRRSAGVLPLPLSLSPETRGRKPARGGARFWARPAGATRESSGGRSVGLSAGNGTRRELF